MRAVRGENSGLRDKHREVFSSLKRNVEDGRKRSVCVHMHM